jgi:hypothetical protein
LEELGALLRAARPEASDTPEVVPVQFVVRKNAQCEQTLDVVEGSFERPYGVGTRRSRSP